MDKNVYINLLGFLAGITNALSIIILGVFTTHVTGAVTNAGVNLGRLNFTTFTLLIGVLTFFIIGSTLATILTGKKSFAASILFSGVLMIIAGLFTPAKIQSGSINQFIFSFLVTTAMGAQNASTTITNLGKTTHVTGYSTEFGIALVKGDRKNLMRLGLFISCFLIGVIVAFFLQNAIGSLSFALVGVGLVSVALLQSKYGFQ